MCARHNSCASKLQIRQNSALSKPLEQSANRSELLCLRHRARSCDRRGRRRSFRFPHHISKPTSLSHPTRLLTGQPTPRKTKDWNSRNSCASARTGFGSSPWTRYSAAQRLFRNAISAQGGQAIESAAKRSPALHRATWATGIRNPLIPRSAEDGDRVRVRRTPALLPFCQSRWGGKCHSGHRPRP
jgi:hypothetical protein